eukprot:357426-Chlamydomonas_euryale.AAC.2
MGAHAWHLPAAAVAVVVVVGQGAAVIVVLCGTACAHPERGMHVRKGRSDRDCLHTNVGEKSNV